MMSSGSRARSCGGMILLLWLFAGMIAALRATMQYTTFGQSVQHRSPSLSTTQMGTRNSKVATEAYGYGGPGYRPSNMQVEGRGAVLAVSVVSALACVVQGLNYVPALALVVLIALILGLSAREGKFGSNVVSWQRR